MKTKQEQIEEIDKKINAYITNGLLPTKWLAEALYDAGYRKAESVYIIMSPEGGIELNIFTGEGTVYADKAKAEEALRRKNEWSKIKGYGVYELVELEVEE